MGKKFLPSCVSKETGVYPVHFRERPSGAVPAIHNWPVEVEKHTGLYELQYQGGTKHQKKTSPNPHRITSETATEISTAGINLLHTFSTDMKA